MLLSGGSAVGNNCLPRQVEPRGGGVRGPTRRMVMACWELAVRRSESIDAVAHGARAVCALHLEEASVRRCGAYGRDPEALLRA